jgi:TolB-like protein/tetratricopeptide (TPR) repeat protein
LSTDPDIFLSYNREDQSTARRFAEAFEAQGFKVWWDQTLCSGEAYDEVTEKALRDAKAVVVLWSKKSVVSRWVRAEATLASRNKTLMPAMIEPCDRPIMFELTQTAELFHWQGDASDKAWLAFLADVSRLAAKDGASQHGAPAKPAERGEIPSIAVLPFANMCGDPEQEYFADGMAEEIITALSHYAWLFVIARNSSFSYKGKSVDVRQIGRELGVRYVLQGSVRKAGSRLRVTAQLIDATDGHHVWAERYERSLEDIFAVQDEMTHNIVGAIAPGIMTSEVNRAQRKRTAELGPWERLMRAHWHIRQFTKEDCHEAIRLIDEVLQRQPNNALALADLAFNLHLASVFGWVDSPEEARARMGAAGRRAVACDDRDAAAHTSLAVDELFRGRNDDAIARLHRAIELDPNSSFAHGYLGVAYAFSGKSEQALQQLENAMRLSPRDYLMVGWHTASAWAHLSAERFEMAAECATRARECNPAFPDAHAALAVASAYLGREADARAALAEFLGAVPGLTTGDQRLDRPFNRAEDRERFIAGLRKAGLPDA